jgi:transaldolase
MKLFIDTANIDHIKEINGWGILSGVTTNPTLCSKECRSFKDMIKEIAAIVDGPISAEALSMKKDEIVKEAKELASIAGNIVIKVPIMPDGLAATKILSEEGIDINMTLIFSANQAMLAAAAGARYVSPFVGRLDDIGNDGMGVIEEIMEAYINFDIDTEVICASIRHPQHVVDAALIGCDISTIPYEVFKKMIKHPLTDKGIESFQQDWEKIKGL